MPKNYSISLKVKAPVGECYRAFTNAMAVREWLCDACSLEPRPGGRIYFGWNEGFQVCGNFIELIKDKEVSFTWHGLDESQKSTVKIVFLEKSDSTEIKLTQTGISNLDEIKSGWEKGFENLRSNLETGVDLRIANRPMLGVLFGEFNEEVAKKMGTPVSSGMKLDDTVEGMGARAAGLQKDDVIVEMDGSPTPDFQAVLKIAQAHKADDEINVVFYRGAEKKQTMMKFSRRPLPEIPATALLCAEKVRGIVDDAMRPFEAALEGVTEVEADFHPASGEWSVKEIVAHLIFGEHGFQSFVNELIFSEERVSDGYADNFRGQVEATVTAYGSLDNLMLELRRAQKETQGIIAALTPEVLAHKGTFWKMCMAFLQPQIHILGHLEQTQAAIKAARQL